MIVSTPRNPWQCHPKQDPPYFPYRTRTAQTHTHMLTCSHVSSGNGERGLCPLAGATPKEFCPNFAGSGYAVRECLLTRTPCCSGYPLPTFPCISSWSGFCRLLHGCLTVRSQPLLRCCVAALLRCCVAVGRVRPKHIQYIIRCCGQPVGSKDSMTLEVSKQASTDHHGRRAPAPFLGRAGTLLRCAVAIVHPPHTLTHAHTHTRTHTPEWCSFCRLSRR